MKRRPPVLAAAFAAIQAGLCPHGALAAERACPGVTIETNPDFHSRWPDLLERVERELSARSDFDACAHVDLRVEGKADILVSVTLPDGRAASRRLTERDDVLPTLQALLLVPASSSPAPAVATSPSAPAQPRTALSDETMRTERDEPPAVTSARALDVELSLFTGARMGDGQLGLGVGALSFLELHGWLIGFEGRADSYRTIGGDGRKTALELAILAGRRFELGSVALDLSAALAAAMLGFDESHSRVQSVSVSRTGTIAEMPPPVQLPEQRSGPVPRLLLDARLGFSPHSVFGTFVGLEGEVGPALASSDPSSAHLPAYSLGVSLGASLGTP